MFRNVSMCLAWFGARIGSGPRLPPHALCLDKGEARHSILPSIDDGRDDRHVVAAPAARSQEPSCRARAARGDGVHLAMKRRDLETVGLDTAAADAEARRAMGNRVLAQDQARDVWMWPWPINDLWYKSTVVYCLDVEKYQDADPNSLLNWTERILRARKECPEIGWGDFTVLRTIVPEVLGMRYDWRDR